MNRRQEASLVDYRNKLIVKPGHKLRLKDVDPAFTGQHETQDVAGPELEQYRQKLTQLQGLLYAEKKHAVLIVLQGLDAAGKDGTIKHVFGALNPQGASVANFKEPTPIERDHDFLWRIHPHAPPKGWLAILNRSHYEDVLVTRVHKLIGKQTCEARYESIRAFELNLQESGTTILKFFLHISKEEQLARFGKRLDDPFRNWKISKSDRAPSLGRLYAGCRKGSRRDEHACGALVCHPRQSQMVSQCGRLSDCRRYNGGAWHGVSQTGRRSRRDTA
jgi:PPK2 family polyphosphate:nucleotide phosphotransferase